MFAFQDAVYAERMNVCRIQKRIFIKWPVLNLKVVSRVYGVVAEGDLSFEDIVNSPSCYKQ